MSTTEKYVHSLKQIKEAEEKAQKEIDEQKKLVTDEFHKFESYVTNAITSTKSNGEKEVESYIDQSRKKANAETEKIIEEANNNSKTISARIDAQTVQEIIEILLKEV